MSIQQELALSKGSTIVSDFDDVFFPANNGTHARIKQLITKSVIKDLGAESLLAKRDDHGHLPYFPQYVLYKYIQTGRNADNPAFVKAMENCYFGDNTQDPAHYRNITANPELHQQLTRLQSSGAKFVILTSGPYNPHVKRVLDQLGVAEFFPRENIYDVGKMCALYKDVDLGDFKDPQDPKLLRWLKPTRENYLAMTHMAGLKAGNNIYLEDNDVNGSRGVTAVPLSETSTQLFSSQFKLSNPELHQLNVSDRWAWINLEGKSLRQGSHAPSIEGKSLVDVLRSVIVEPERQPLLRQSEAYKSDNALK